MRAGTWRAVTGGAVLVVVLGAGAVWWSSGRTTLGAFLTPVPLASAPGSVMAPSLLPTEVALPGGESRELAKLAANSGLPPERAPREALFPVKALSASPRTSDRTTRLSRPDIVDRDDARTDAAVSFLMLDAHAHTTLLAMAQRAGRYRPTVERILRAWKVPDDLIAVIFVENGFLPGAVQKDGSAGLWSLPLDVAEVYGITVRDTYDERRGVESSSEVAGRYLADLRERFGSWGLALYAYSHGYKRTLAEVARGHSAKFEDLIEELGAEDRSYVFQVFAVATILSNPDRFSMDTVHPDPPLATSDLEVPAQAPFAVIAQAAGTTVSRLHELNPEYLTEIVPTTGNAMIVHLPREGLARAKSLLTPLLYAPPGTLNVQVGRVGESSDGGPGQKGPTEGTGAHNDRATAQGAPLSPGQQTYYRVRDGDTLDAVARRFGVARETIASDNALDVTASLLSGQLLRIRNPAPPPSGGK
jgi:membrane-bound lytic murein transglycosylase D